MFDKLKKSDFWTKREPPEIIEQDKRCEHEWYSMYIRKRVNGKQKPIKVGKICLKCSYHEIQLPSY